MQLTFRSHVMQPAPKPPPGFSQAAPFPEVTVRSVQPNCPPTLKSIRACTATHQVPSPRLTGESRLMVKSSPLSTYDCAVFSATIVPGRPPAS